MTILLAIIGAILVIISFTLLTDPFGEAVVSPIVLGILGIGMLIFVGLAMDIQSDKENINQDPKVGIVNIKGIDGMSKKCDGSTLIYIGNRTSNIVINSPECK